MMMPEPGDVVLFVFPGAHETKRRPAVVVSSAAYHAARPDVIVGMVTTQLQQAVAPTDYIFTDWAAAQLHAPSAFRSYFYMSAPRSLTPIGRLSLRDWEGVRRCLGAAFGLAP